MKINSSTTLGMALLTALAFSAANVKAETITFDEVTAPSTFSSVTPGGDSGPTKAYTGVTFTGGVILNDSKYANESTTSPNLYATADIANLADNSTLPGVITGTFSSAGEFSFIKLDIANGFSAADFTLSAFDASNNLIGFDTISLGNYGSSGAVGHASVSGLGIDHFTVTTSAGAGSRDFGIDTVRLTNGKGAVPEPSQASILGVGMFGLAGLFFIARRKQTA